MNDNDYLPGDLEARRRGIAPKAPILLNTEDLTVRVGWSMATIPPPFKPSPTSVPGPGVLYQKVPLFSGETLLLVLGVLVLGVLCAAIWKLL